MERREAEQHYWIEISTFGNYFFYLKFSFYKKARKIDEIFTVDLTFIK